MPGNVQQQPQARLPDIGAARRQRRGARAHVAQVDHRLEVQRMAGRQMPGQHQRPALDLGLRVVAQRPLEHAEAVTQAEGRLRRRALPHEGADSEPGFQADSPVRVIPRRLEHGVQDTRVEELLLRLRVVLHARGQHLGSQGPQHTVWAPLHRAHHRRQAAHLGQVTRNVQVLHMVTQLLCEVREKHTRRE